MLTGNGFLCAEAMQINEQNVSIESKTDQKPCNPISFFFVVAAILCVVILNLSIYDSNFVYFLVWIGQKRQGKPGWAGIIVEW